MQTSSATTPPPQYKYRVKVINPKNKKDYKWLALHGVTTQFLTPLHLKQQLVESLGDYVPARSEIDSFNVGYLQKPSQAKQWIVSGQDLESMYAHSGEEISLWCDHRVEDPPISTGSKRSSDTRSTRTDDAPPKKNHRSTNYAEREDKIEEMATELEGKHGDKYSYPQYKLWARLITCGQHGDKENAPNVPMITGSYSKERKLKESNFNEAIAGAAVAIVKALKQSPEKNEITPTTVAAVSPGKKVMLSGQYLKQLETIQRLKDEGVLTIAEFQAQKERIMDNLHSLN